jgi:succinate dehydrogenase / fumarate reductase flavoprotein subunit
MQDSMMDYVGVFREDAGMKQAVDIIQDLRERYQHIVLDDKGRRYNTDVLEAWELGALLDTAEVTAAAALNRTESRGGHYREDYPKRDDGNWLKHSLAWRKDGGIVLGYKPVTITDYEPKERVY